MTKDDFDGFDGLMGWAGTKNPTLVRDEFDLLKDDFHKFRIVGSAPIEGARSMLWEVSRKVLGEDTENYAQQIGDCCVKDTVVLMASGKWRPIQDIAVGDYVVTHLNNKKRVCRTINKKYSGRLYTVRAKKHWTAISTTADHEFISYQDDDCKRGEWKSAASLSVDEDSILIPYSFQEVEYNNLYYYDKKILVDEDFATIIGWYLAEGGISTRNLLDGSTSCQKVTFNLSLDEDWVAELLIEKIGKVFALEAVKQYHKEKQNVLLVEVYNTDFSNFIHRLIPDNLYGKKIPTVIFTSPRDIKMACLKAWVAGDGHYTSSSACGTSSSHELIRDFFHLSVSCGLFPSVSYIPKEEHQTVDAGVITFRNNSFREIIGRELAERDNLCQRNTRARHPRFNGLGQLREIEYIDYEEVRDIDVYCLEVEDDHSFIANGYAIHNCVSFGGKNATEYVQFYPIVNGHSDEFKNIFPPYLYGCGRVFIGKGQVNGDGSLGVWQAKAVMEYGAIPTDTPNCPQYSGDIAKKWGNSGPPDEFVSVGKTHIVKSAALVSSWDELVTALVNGYPVTVASDIGYDMKPRSDGFNHNSTSWGHQMCFIGVDNRQEQPYACILNSWGDAHGQIKDFKTGENWPIGTLRVLKSDAEKMIKQGDTFAYSSFNGFPAQKLPRSFFDLF